MQDAAKRAETVRQVAKIVRHFAQNVQKLSDLNKKRMSVNPCDSKALGEVECRFPYARSLK